MPDVALSVLVHRDLLGLAPLQIGMGPRYYCAPQFIGAAVQWQRQQVTSPYFDGSVTVQRYRQQPMEQIAVEVKGDDLGEVQDNVDELVSAFIQDSYVLDITADNASFSYVCEAADYQVGFFNTARMVSRQVQVVFSVPRNPVPLVGVA